MSSDPLRALIARWRDDPGGTYRSWFLWEERLKNFRSIRRGIQRVVAEIASGRFDNTYRGSSLETVVGSIADRAVEMWHHAGGAGPDDLRRALLICEGHGCHRQQGGCGHRHAMRIGASFARATARRGRSAGEVEVRRDGPLTGPHRFVAAAAHPRLQHGVIATTDPSPLDQIAHRLVSGIGGIP